MFMFMFMFDDAAGDRGQMEAAHPVHFIVSGNQTVRGVAAAASERYAGHADESASRAGAGRGGRTQGVSGNSAEG